MAPRGRRLGPGDINPRITTTKQRAYRATGTDTEATDLPAINRRGARYDRPGGPTNFYASLSEGIPPLEIERRMGLRLDRFRLTKVEIKGRLLDAYGREGLLGLGLRRDDLVQKDNTTCLELADLAEQLECSGVIVPSAVAPDAANIVVWHDHVPRVVRVLGWTTVTMDFPPPEASTG